MPIPTTFSERFLWTFGDARPPIQPANPSSLAPNGASRPKECAPPTFKFSAGVFGEMNSLISCAFRGIERQLRSGTPFLDAPLGNKAVIISCGQGHGTLIIDAALKEAAMKQAADILVIDAFELACGRFGAFGNDAEVIDKLYSSVRRVPKMENIMNKGDSDLEAVEDLNTDVCHFVDSVLATSPPEHTAEPTRRIIYMRNFQAISSIAKPLMTYLLYSLFVSPKADTYPPEPYPVDQHASKRADLVVFGMNDSGGTLETGAHPASIAKDSLFLSALFNHVREKPKKPCSSRPFPSMLHHLSTLFDSGPGSETLPDTLQLETVPFNANMGKKVDELTEGALRTSIFAYNVEQDAEGEGWQRHAKVEQAKLLNQTLLRASLERAGGQPEVDLNEVQMWDDPPSSVFSIQQATNIVHNALGLMPTSPHFDESPKTFKDWLQDSYKACEQRKKEREDWMRGINPVKSDPEGKAVKRKEEVAEHNEDDDSDDGDDGDDEEAEDGEKLKEKAKEGITEKSKDSSVDDLTSDVSWHAKELKGCIVDIDGFHTTFSDVFVDPAIIESLKTIVSLPLLYPSYFKSGILAKEAIGGILLYGPPGTGKTMLCRALAKTSQARMIHIKPSDINDKYVGEAEKKIAAVFELAHRLAPCIVFADELDGLFSKRTDCTKSWERNILTEFMQGMDGLGSAQRNRDNNIVVVGATNRPFDLDPAILRRMPRRILVDMPGMQMRKGILTSYLEEEVLDESVNVERLAIETEGFSGSDLKNLCVAAALASVKDAVGPHWKGEKTPPTPSKVFPNPPFDEEEKERKDVAKQESGDRVPDLPVRVITPANIRHARSEIVKSNAGGGLDQLYNWHQSHMPTFLPERNMTMPPATGTSGSDMDLRFPFSRLNTNKAF